MIKSLLSKFGFQADGFSKGDTNLETVMIQLEEKELVNVGDCDAADYEKLMAIYLTLNDLISAKFLWQRIPLMIKESSDWLKLIWEVGKSLITNDFVAVFGKIDGQSWPPHLSTIMDRLRSNHQSHMVNLISKGYTAISSDDAMKLNGCSTEEEILRIGESAGWKVDAPFGFIINQCVLGDEDSSFSSDQQERLENLTDYISFLENHD